MTLTASRPSRNQLADGASAVARQMNAACTHLDATASVVEQSAIAYEIAADRVLARVREAMRRVDQTSARVLDTLEELAGFLGADFGSLLGDPLLGVAATNGRFELPPDEDDGGTVRLSAEDLAASSQREEPTLEEVRNELAREGIDVGPAVARVKRALAANGYPPQEDIPDEPDIESDEPETHPVTDPSDPAAQVESQTDDAGDDFTVDLSEVPGVVAALHPDVVHFRRTENGQVCETTTIDLRHAAKDDASPTASAQGEAPEARPTVACICPCGNSTLAFADLVDAGLANCPDCLMAGRGAVAVGRHEPQSAAAPGLAKKARKPRRKAGA